MPPAIVHWFRRDLRLHDHPTLLEAVRTAEESGGRVVPLFVLDPSLLAAAGANRSWWTLQSVAALRAAGVPVCVRRGRPADVVTAVARECDAAEVWADADATPVSRARDRKVADALAADGRRLVTKGGPYAVAPGTVRKSDGTPFQVFTPFRRAWEPLAACTEVAPAVDPRAVPWLALDGGALDPPAPTATRLPKPGEAAAAQRLAAFLADGLHGYAERRDRPDLDATSRLSPYLKAGVLHPRTILAAVDESPHAGSQDAAAFRSELAWREFYADVLFHRPRTRTEEVQPAMAAMAHDVGPEADECFAAWREGRTGYPIVDAGMRQLRAEGWMHNRVRMIVASFLVKDLHLDWRRGAQHFLDHLLDGDVASNQHGWQWTAGTGTDAAPYFRIFNPAAQGQRFDPDGRYVRRYVPELAEVADRFVQEPWKAPARPTSASLFDAPGTDRAAPYPPPIVDHAEEREVALRRYADVRSHRTR